METKVDTDPAAVLTANPVVSGNKLIVGVSSNEEGVASGLYGPYDCCTFRGKVVALNPNTGAIQWSTYTVPSSSGAGDSNLHCTGSAQTGDDNPTGCDYTGGAVWDTPAIDADKGLVFVGTGNNYTTPDSAVECKENGAGRQHFRCKLHGPERLLRLCARAEPRQRKSRLGE